jgi:hypothetical protein
MDKSSTTAEIVADINRRTSLAMDNPPTPNHPLRRKADANPPLTVEDLKQHLRLTGKMHRGFYGDESVIIKLLYDDTELGEVTIETKKEDSPY